MSCTRRGQLCCKVRVPAWSIPWQDPVMLHCRVTLLCCSCDLMFPPSLADPFHLNPATRARTLVVDAHVYCSIVDFREIRKYQLNNVSTSLSEAGCEYSVQPSEDPAILHIAVT